jgi:hypothetical protein
MTSAQDARDSPNNAGIIINHQDVGALWVHR